MVVAVPTPHLFFLLIAHLFRAFSNAKCCVVFLFPFSDAFNKPPSSSGSLLPRRKSSTRSSSVAPEEVSAKKVTKFDSSAASTSGGGSGSGAGTRRAHRPNPPNGNRLEMAAWHHTHSYAGRPFQPSNSDIDGVVGARGESTIQRAASLKQTAATTATTGKGGAIPARAGYVSTSMDRRVLQRLDQFTNLASRSEVPLGGTSTAIGAIGGGLSMADAKLGGVSYSSHSRQESGHQPCYESTEIVEAVGSRQQRPLHTLSSSRLHSTTQQAVKENLPSSTAATASPALISAPKLHKSSRSVVSSSRFPSAMRQQPITSTSSTSIGVVPGVSRAEPRHSVLTSSSAAASPNIHRRTAEAARPLMHSPPPRTLGESLEDGFLRRYGDPSTDYGALESEVARLTAPQQIPHYPTATLQRKIKAYCEAANIRDQPDHHQQHRQQHHHAADSQQAFRPSRGPERK